VGLIEEGTQKCQAPRRIKPHVSFEKMHSRLSKHAKVHDPKPFKEPKKDNKSVNYETSNTRKALDRF
jgi:hypothetical protein